MNAERAKVTVRGAVQGVGFRPHVFRLATELRLDGWVLNSSQGVFIEAEGAPDTAATVSPPAGERETAARGDPKSGVFLARYGRLQGLRDSRER